MRQLALLGCMLIGSAVFSPPVALADVKRYSTMMDEPKPKSEKPNPKPDDPEQSKRFVETAREIGADETGEAFRRAFEKIVPPKRNK